MTSKKGSYIATEDCKFGLECYRVGLGTCTYKH